MEKTEREKFADFRRLLLRTENIKHLICARCGYFSKSVDLHHLEELIFGGSNEVGNLVPLCRTCHIDWDDCGEIGMSFGEFLVSLSSVAWQAAAHLGLFRSNMGVGVALENIYKMQFNAQSIKYNRENLSAYWQELKRQNKIFTAYPYSDHAKMLELYGDMYKPLSDNNFEEYTKARLAQVESKYSAWVQGKHPAILEERG